MDLVKLLQLPIVASAHGHKIDMMIVFVHLLMFALFVGWGAFFIISLIKFNKRANPKANYHGVHSHVSSYLEVLVAVIEAVLLIGFSIPFWAKQVNALPTRPDKMEVHIVAEQFAWNIHYPGADGKFGKTDVKFFDKQANPLGLDPQDPDGKDDITTVNQLHVPIGKPVIVYLTSRDVMHSFGIPLMRVKMDVVPGIRNMTWFTPTKSGEFDIVCSQLCGLGHYRMKGFVNVHSQQDYDKWLSEQAAASGSSSGEDSFWN